MEQKLYTFTFEYRPEYLHAEVDVGEITFAIGIAYINELVSEVRKSGVDKVLFVRHTTSVLSRKDYTMLVNVFLNILPADVRFAVVDQSPQPELISDVITSETIIRKGSIRAFGTVEEAERWLLS
jgi:hypothetical protein